ncbi:hypothetical protein SAMN05421837_115122 [Amycolatopsis pretoriensis]|uniref:DUF2690 domain-containing protein n=1 Tax=Amycolatopsis pretoriensis TaxID=218821 RepID=A0A1H5RJV2_9PSEU|nr:hypothetical protein [Amycolatopsis pretoriensis]SEF37771.1 hypothetical protein SAMN05421837_115122 [Amycolatopsis pretoriensis]
MPNGRMCASIGAALVTVVVGAAPAVAETGPAAAATPAYCNNDDPAGFPPDQMSSPRSTWLRGDPSYTELELRYWAKGECAWGRITNGVVGDQIWVDRKPASQVANDPHQQLGATQITSGSSKYTYAWDDHNFLMRTCGRRAGGGTDTIRCTAWF